MDIGTEPPADVSSPEGSEFEGSASALSSESPPGGSELASADASVEFSTVGSELPSA